MGSDETTPRDRLVATVAVLHGCEDEFVLKKWEAAEAYVAALELFPLNTAKCPCCDKTVQLCVKHYQLHEPGKKCSGCREEE